MEVGEPEAAPRPDPQEIASTIARTLSLPEIADLRPRLAPEWPVYAMVAGEATPTALSGRIDAIAFEEGQAATVLDWKSDVSPTESDVKLHALQIRDYLEATGAARGALVYMTPGVVRWVRRAEGETASARPEAGPGGPAE